VDSISRGVRGEGTGRTKEFKAESRRGETNQGRAISDLSGLRRGTTALRGGGWGGGGGGFGLTNFWKVPYQLSWGDQPVWAITTTQK